MTKPNEPEGLVTLPEAARDLIRAMRHDQAKVGYRLDLWNVLQACLDAPTQPVADAATAAKDAEIAILRLELEKSEALQDGAYKAGLAAGWNFAHSDDEAGFQRARTSTEHVAELKRIRAALSEAREAGEWVGEITIMPHDWDQMVSDGSDELLSYDPENETRESCVSRIFIAMVRAHHKQQGQK